MERNQLEDPENSYSSRRKDLPKEQTPARRTPRVKHRDGVQAGRNNNNNNNTQKLDRDQSTSEATASEENTREGGNYRIPRGI